MGSVYTPLVINNVGTRTCTVHGYPGVSLLDASGSQIDAPATRDTGVAATTVVLAPGASAAALLHTVNGALFGIPCRGPSAKVRIYPPDEYDAIVIAAAYTECHGFSVRPFVAGTTGT